MTELQHTPGQTAAFDAFERATLGNTPDYPNDIAFIPNDIPHADALLAAHVRDGRAVAVVSASGGEMLVLPAARHGVAGLLDRVTRRTRVSIQVRGGGTSDIEMFSTVSTRAGSIEPPPAHVPASV